MNVNNAQQINNNKLELLWFLDVFKSLLGFFLPNNLPKCEVLITSVTQFFFNFYNMLIAICYMLSLSVVLLSLC